MSRSDFSYRVIGETLAGSLIIEMHPAHYAALLANHLHDLGDLSQLGATVRLWRKTNAVTQTDFAKAAGLSRTMLSLIESGTRKNMTLKTAVRLLEAMQRPLFTEPAND